LEAEEKEMSPPLTILTLKVQSSNYLLTFANPFCEGRNNGIPLSLSSPLFIEKIYVMSDKAGSWGNY